MVGKRYVYVAQCIDDNGEDPHPIGVFDQRSDAVDCIMISYFGHAKVMCNDNNHWMHDDGSRKCDGDHCEKLRKMVESGCIQNNGGEYTIHAIEFNCKPKEDDPLQQGDLDF